MPVDERLHSATGSVLDLEPDQYPPGVVASINAPSTVPLYIGGIRQDASGAGGAGADAALYNVAALGLSSIVPALTVVSFATGAGAAGTFTATFTKPGGVGSAEVIIFDNTTKKVIGKADLTSTGTATITGAPVGASVGVCIRPIATDGTPGATQNVGTVTTHA